MNKAIGLVEYKSVAAGITAADRMVKAAEIELLEAQTVCPGKYIVLLSGRLSDVQAAIDAGSADFGDSLIDSFVLGNPHPAIFSGMNGTTELPEVEALGIIETYSAASAIVAADTSAKTAQVDILEIRLAKGMCGKSYVLLTGELAAVEHSVQKALIETKASGMLINHSVIPRPDPKLWEKLI